MARRNATSQRPVRPTSQPAPRKGLPLSPLAEKMLADMQLAGLSERTHESYLRAVRKFAQWLRKSPDLATEHELRNYLLHIKNDQQWGANSLKVAYSGLKFFYSRTCPRDWSTLKNLRVGQERKLPAVLSIAANVRLRHSFKAPQVRPRSAWGNAPGEGRP